MKVRRYSSSLVEVMLGRCVGGVMGRGIYAVLDAGLEHRKEDD